MKSFAYAYAIATFHIDKKMNVFKMKESKSVIMSNLKKINYCQVANSKASYINQRSSCSVISLAEA
jgi:hypothetical protein